MTPVFPKGVRPGQHFESHFINTAMKAGISVNLNEILGKKSNLKNVPQQDKPKPSNPAKEMNAELLLRLQSRYRAMDASAEDLG